MAGASRYWNQNSQKHIEAKGHGPAYSKDGGRKLDDRQTDPPYNANIGPDGPNLNVVGFDTVKVATKFRYMMPDAASNSYDAWDAPGGFGGPAEGGGTDYAGMAGKAGDILKKVGGALDEGKQKPTEARSMDPGHSGGTGDVRVPVSRSVQRRGKDY